MMARLFYCFKGADNGPQLEEQAPTASTSAVPASLPQQACSNSSKQKRTSIFKRKSKLGHFTSSTLFTHSSSRLQSKPGLEVKSQLDLIMSYARSPLAIFVLACRHCSDGGCPSGTEAAGSVHINLDPVYCNVSALKAFHLPLPTSPDEADGDGAPGVLHAMERLEPFLLQDVRDHILRLASNDPSGSFTLHLASGKYPLGPACVVPSQSNGQLMDSAQIISRPKELTAAGGAITEPVPPFTPPRLWQYVVVEPFIYNARGLTQSLEGFAPSGTTATRGDKGSRGSPQRRYSKLYRITPRRLTSNEGQPANPAVNGISLKDSAAGIQFGSGMLPAIILSFELLQKAQQARVLPHACAAATTTTDELWPVPQPQPRQRVLSPTALHAAASARMVHTMAESVQSPNRAGSGYATDSHSVSMAVITADEFYGSSRSSRQQHYQVQHQVQRYAPHLQRPLRMSCCDLHMAGARPVGPAGSSGGHVGVDSGAGKCAGYGSFSHGSLTQSVAEAFRARESMVLAGLAHIVTAFTLNGAAVLYQNAASIFYFGFRGRARTASIRATKRTQGGSMLAAAANSAALSGAEDDSVNENILAEVFCLEPVKLERMLNEVCKEGRVWKGIVQVPGSCHPALIPMTVAPTVGGRGCTGGGGRNAAAVPPVVAAKASVQWAPGHAAAASDSNHAKGTSTPPAPLKTPQQPEPPQPQSSQPRLLPLELQSTSIPPESPAGSLLPHVSGLDSHQEFISTEVAAAADEACSSLLHVGLCTLDVSVPEHVEAFRKMQSIVELDPLATSTWGLLMDTPDQGTQQEGTLARDGIGTVTATDVLTQQLLSSGANAPMPKGITSGPSAAGPQSISTTISTTSHAWPGQPLQRRDVTYKKDVPEETAASRVQTSPCPSPGRTVLDNCGGRNGQGRQLRTTEQPLPAKLQPASMPSAYGASLRRSSDLVFGSDVNSSLPGNTPIANSGCSGIAPAAPAATAAAGLVGRTSSALMYSISHQQQVLAARSTGTPRRSFSRVDLCPPVPATVTAGRGVSRVVTFASTLRNTPSAVQVALQAAMASSTSVTRSRSSLAGDIVSIAGSRNVSNLSQAGAVKGEETGAARRRLKQFIYGAIPAGSQDSIGGLTQAVGAAGVYAPKPSAAAAPSNQHLCVDGTFSEAQSWCTSRFEKEDLLIPLQPRFHARARTASCGMRSSDALYGVETPPLPRASEDKSGLNGASQHPTQGVITLSSDAINDAAKMDSTNGIVKADAAVGTDPSGKGVHRIQRGRMQSAVVVRGTNKMREMKLLLGTSPDGGDDGVKRHGNGDDESEVEEDDDQQPMFEESIVNGFAIGPKTAETATMGATAAAGITCCWHEISASRTIDPVTGQCAIILTQTDVTAKVEAESHIALVTETEHRLLEQIFPRHVLAYMTEEGGPWDAPTKPDLNRWRPMVRDINKLATSHDEVTLLFADIQGFTPMCKVLEPRVVMAFLNDLFTRFDRRLDEFGVYKVETIGDCYFAVGGLVHEDEYGMAAVRPRDGHADPHHAEKVMKFAKAMLSAASRVSLPTTGGPVKMRIGIHSGPVVSGVVGQRMPRFCLFGDTVNTASRMESTGVPGCIHASEAARALLRNEAWVPTGGIEVKGKGLMNTYLWAPPGSEEQQAAFAVAAAVAAQQQQKHPLQQRTLNQKTSSSPQLAPVKKTSAALPPALGDGFRLSTILGSSGASGSTPGSGAAAATLQSTGPPIALAMNSAGGFAHVWASKTGSVTGGGGTDASVRDLVKVLLPVGGP